MIKVLVVLPLIGRFTIIERLKAPGRTKSPPPQTEMLTPKGEHPFPPFYQGDVRWENQVRRNRNSAKNLGSWILWLPALQVK
jgi:hypothetical protein